MEVTVLFCDKCPGLKKAVVVLSLLNGHATKDAPRLDLCAGHANQMYRNFAPRKRSKVAHGHPGPATKKAKAPDRVSTNPRVIAAKAVRVKMVEFAKAPVSRKQMMEKFKVNEALMGYYLGVLVKDGSLKKVGKGNKITYVRAKEGA